MSVSYNESQIAACWRLLSVRGFAPKGFYFIAVAGFSIKKEPTPEDIDVRGSKMTVINGVLSLLLDI